MKRSISTYIALVTKQWLSAAVNWALIDAPEAEEKTADKRGTISLFSVSLCTPVEYNLAS